MTTDEWTVASRNPRWAKNQVVRVRVGEVLVRGVARGHRGLAACSVDVVGTLKLAHVGHNSRHLALRHPGHRWHVTEGPVVTQDALAHRALECGVGMVTRFIHRVDERGTAIRTRGVRSVARGAMGVEELRAGSCLRAERGNHQRAPRQVLNPPHARSEGNDDANRDACPLPLRPAAPCTALRGLGCRGTSGTTHVECFLGLAPTRAATANASKRWVELRSGGAARLPADAADRGAPTTRKCSSRETEQETRADIRTDTLSTFAPASLGCRPASGS